MKLFFLHNKFVVFLLILLLVALNILVISKISFIFVPIGIIVKTVMLPLILAGIAFYLLNPIVDLLERHKINRIYSIIGLFLVIIGVVTILILTVFPFVKDQVLNLVDNLPKYGQQVAEKFNEFAGTSLFHQFNDKLNNVSTDIMNYISEKSSVILQNAWASVSGVVGTVTEIVLAIATLPFILFYLLKDGRKLPRFILNMLPVKTREHTYQMMYEMHHQISSYIRGQIIVSFCIGFLLFVGYLVIGLNYALVLAIIASLTSIVPYLGPVIAITPAIIISAVTSPAMLVKLAVVWIIVQLIEGKFISPQVMGKNLSVHPITIIFVILIGGNLFGILGIIFAVPGYAVLKVIVLHIFEWFKSYSGLYE
ncbi:putative membrane protein [Paenibacillus larvae subsp. larvae DSM 25430]|uniref:Putative membrane protein n=1 Tax=Paenibacillus larvae subsp. larvae DSM 25430 TaxID=697284 RepID=V9WD37_9BACL|nr:putative membrane protein [Paenibacillus larvae subsp. larvae DSM 25430]